MKTNVRRAAAQRRAAARNRTSPIPPRTSRRVAARRVGRDVFVTIEEVLEVTGGKLLSGQGRPHAAIRRLWTDSRTIARGDLFVALPGERFDGHQFVAKVLQQGAAGALVSLEGWPGVRAQLPAKDQALIIAVPDPLLAYQQLAAYHRQRFAIPVIAVTGSNGKTTTKEMTAHVIGERWPVLKTEGNFNNRIGVPHTLLRLTPRHRAAVIEMGVDHRGQTTRLGEIARPTIGLITNIGPDHLEFFGTLDASAEAKGELLDLLPEDGWAVLNADDPYFGYLAARARCRVISFGMNASADVRAVHVVQNGRKGMQFDLILPGRSRPTPVVLPTHGSHNLLNALAAAAVGHVCEISGTRIARALTRFKPAAMRSQIESGRGTTIINDCYNANPASMNAALDLLAEMGKGRRTIAVLGDMLELGPTGPQLHRDVGRYVAMRDVTTLIACGPLSRELAAGARAAGLAADRVREAADAAAA